MIKWLDEIDKSDFETVGGKAANLGELWNANFAVPYGFVVQKYDKNNPDWEFEIEEGYNLLRRGQVAVRSSARAEDGNVHSFAGQYDSYLNQEGEDKVVSAVINCFESVNNKRAIFYREAVGITDTKMSVIVQKMIPATCAGVVFTKDPVQDDNSVVGIEIVPGLGESLVSGMSIPDSYIVDKQAFEVIDATYTTPLIADNTILRIARIALDIEEHFGCPQDIEFCIGAGQIWILQARPITT